MKLGYLATLAAALFCAAQSAAIAKPAALTPEQMRRFGEKAVILGFADQAIAIADQLLLRDSQDTVALVIKAQALRIVGNIPASEAIARKAWRLAKNAGQPKGLAYSSATAVAQALSLQGKRTAAQLWLRRAAEAAPSGAAREQALQDFDYVRQQNPLQLRFDLTARPSDNVNGGARDPLFNYHGIPFTLSGDALALSGVSWGAGVQGRYRLAASPIGETALTFEASHQGVLLSKQAKLQAPNAQNGDYSLDQAQISFEKLLGAEPAAGLPTQWRFGVNAGQTWYAGTLLSVDYGASVGFDHQFEKFGIGGDASLSQHDRQDHALSSSTELGLTSNVSFASQSGDRWQATLNYQHASSDDITVDHQEGSLSLGWQAGKKLYGMALGATLGLNAADYAVSPYSANGRQDKGWHAGLTAELDNLSYLGFAPVVGLDYSRADSNISIYDTKALGLTLSIRSQF